MSAKSDILEWIKNGADLNVGITLFEKYGNNPHFLNICKGNKDANKEMLNYQLCQLVNISEYQFKQLLNTNKKQLARKGKTIKIPKIKKKYRDEFPFLNDENCPYELKILVADRITAWKKYTEAHKQLFTGGNYYRLAKTIIDNYKENRLIYEELNYYKEHKTILGKHRIFKRFERIKQLQKLNVLELDKKRRNIRHNIWRIKQQIAKGDKPHLLTSREQQIIDKQAELDEINKIIGNDL